MKQTKASGKSEKDFIDSDKVNNKSDNDFDNDNVVRVGVHVRRTDYINWVQNKSQVYCNEIPFRGASGGKVWA